MLSRLEQMNQEVQEVVVEQGEAQKDYTLAAVEMVDVEVPQLLVPAHEYSLQHVEDMPRRQFLGGKLNRRVQAYRDLQEQEQEGAEHP